MLDRKQKIARAIKSGNSHNISHQIAAQMSELLGENYIVNHERERPWASITFTGTRHQITVRSAENGSENWHDILSQLPEHEFTLRGCFVADVAVDIKQNNQHAMIEVLTIVDPVESQ